MPGEYSDASGRAGLLGSIRSVEQRGESAAGVRESTSRVERVSVRASLRARDGDAYTAAAARPFFRGGYERAAHTAAARSRRRNECGYVCDWSVSMKRSMSGERDHSERSASSLRREQNSAAFAYQRGKPAGDFGGAGWMTKLGEQVGEDVRVLGGSISEREFFFSHRSFGASRVVPNYTVHEMRQPETSRLFDCFSGRSVCEGSGGIQTGIIGDADSIASYQFSAVPSGHADDRDTGERKR